MGGLSAEGGGPVYEYNDLLLSNLPIPLATEPRSWTDVKALFD